MQIYTIQMSKAKSVQKQLENDNVKFVDITVKNNPGHILSPNWDMVWGSKTGKYSNAQYEERYRKLLKIRKEINEKEFIDFFNQSVDKLFLMCFCSSSSFCHRHLAISILKDIYQELKEEGRLSQDLEVEFKDEWK